jgi:PBP1b-binding outer membrane lipoprotein LpoB
MRKIFVLIISALLLAACTYEKTEEPEKAEPKEEVATKEVKAEPKPKTKPKEDQPAPKPATLMTGESGAIKEDKLAALGTKENLDELVKFAAAGNNGEVTRMVMDGKAIVLEAGTKITVLERGVMSAKIRIDDTQEEAYVPIEFLNQ